MRHGLAPRVGAFLDPEQVPSPPGSPALSGWTKGQGLWAPEEAVGSVVFKFCIPDKSGVSLPR